MKQAGKPKPCIVFDIDGVLSNHSQRLQHALNRDWDTYHGLAKSDPPIIEMVLLARAMTRLGFKLVICTGRPEKYRLDTDAWLEAQGIDYHILYMRGDNDLAPSDILKLKLLDRLRAQGFTVWYAVEDQSHVVEMWRSNGVWCLQAPDFLPRGIR